MSAPFVPLDERSVPAVVLEALSGDLFLEGSAETADLHGLSEAAAELSIMPFSDLISSL